MVKPKISIWRILLKATLLFVVANLLLSMFGVQPFLSRLSLYNWLLPGRERLPYGDDPTLSYNLSLVDLDAMFASHEVARSKVEDEFRVLVIGDSSVWGFLLENKDTLTSALNVARLRSDDGRRVVFYNLGQPSLSLTKDLMLLDYAMRYEPDLILWPVTLEAFPIKKQSGGLVNNNADRIQRLIEHYDLPTAIIEDSTSDSFFDRTLIGQRRRLANLIRLQLYGFMWAATGIDVYIPDVYKPHEVDMDPKKGFLGMQPPDLHAEDLAVGVLGAGIQRAGDVPVLIINEPIFVTNGANSDIRYNQLYPRWAYDDYREMMEALSAQNGWNYADLWQAADNSEFTNSPIHLTPQGTLELSNAILPILSEKFNLKP